MNILKKISNFFVYLYEAISYWGINENSSEFERDFTILINQSIAVLATMFFIEGISVIVFVQAIADGIFLLIISCLWITSMLLKEKRKNKYFITGCMLSLCFLTTYYTIYCGPECGVFLLYFPLAFYSAFYFDTKKDKKYIYLIIGVILLSFYGSVFYDSSLLDKSRYTINGFARILLMLHITFSGMLFAVAYYFIIEKKSAFYYSREFSRIRAIRVEFLKGEIRELLKNQFVDTNISEEKVKELLNLAQQNDPLLLEKFQQYFPGFFKKLQNQANPALTHSDLYLCVMMKFNFSAKQIAMYTSSTVKAIESKKYRLRKKLNIPSDKETILWISSI